MLGYVTQANFEKSLQSLNEGRVARLNRLWNTAADLEISTLIRGTQTLRHLCSEISKNDPRLDSTMFLRHNPVQWQEPAPFLFVPSPVWHDDDSLVADQHAKTVLQNTLIKSKDQLGILQDDVDKKRREIDGAKRVVSAIRNGADKRDEVEISRGIFVLEDRLLEFQRKKVMAEAEIFTITSALGDISVGVHHHNFKQQVFKIPTNCDLCGDRIWGLSAKGFDCKDCGYTCHSKCEIKVPADCPGEQSKEERKLLKSERQEATRALYLSHSKTDMSVSSTLDGELQASSMRSSSNQSGNLSRSDTIGTLATLGSGLSAKMHRSTSKGSPRAELDGTPSGAAIARMSASSKIENMQQDEVLPPLSHHTPKVHGEEGLTHRAKMLYPYEPRNEGEIAVNEGEDVVIVEPDGKQYLAKFYHQVYSINV